MRVLHLFLLVAAASSGAHASWFSSSASSNEYTSWSTSELKAWLVAHQVPLPSSAVQSSSEAQREALLNQVKSNWDTASSWTQEQYQTAQSAFTDLRDSAFDAWDESALRAWLLEQGIVSPNSPKEELVLLAKHRYNDYRKAASQFGESVKETADSASASASSIAATATSEVAKALDDTKDYVYSSWDDNRLRSYLESKGVLKSKEKKTRDEMLAMMKKEYADVADPVWNAWSTSYMHAWLATHNLIPQSQLTTTDKIEQQRATLSKKMQLYYYDTSQKVWDAWSDSDLHKWLVDNNVIADNAKASRDKMIKMVEESYTNASSTILAAWDDSQLRAMLVRYGVIDDRTAFQKKRDELIQIVKDQYATTAKALTPSTSTSWLAWPDARLRAYLAERGVKERRMPRTREELIRAVREVMARPTAKVETSSESWGEWFVDRAELAKDWVVETFTGAKQRVEL